MVLSWPEGPLADGSEIQGLLLALGMMFRASAAPQRLFRG
jgi:hypothetical protein